MWNGTDRCQNVPSNLITPYRGSSRLTWILVAYPWPSFSAVRATNQVLTSFDQQAQICLGMSRTSYGPRYYSFSYYSGDVDMVNPEREPMPRRRKPCASLKTTQKPCPFTASCSPLYEDNTSWSDQFSPQKPLRPSLSFYNFSIPLAHRRLRRPLPSPNLVLTRLVKRETARLRVLRRPTRLSATVSPAPRLPPHPEGNQIGDRKRHTG